MISDALQFGYLGLLALLIFLCYKIIENSERTFKETLIIVCFFSIVSLVGGGAGYFWASKELEVAKAKESTAAILKQQVSAMRDAHIKSMTPLQAAMDGAVKHLNESVLSSTRQEHLEEINQINSVIKERDEQFSKSISALSGVFNQITQ